MRRNCKLTSLILMLLLVLASLNYAFAAEGQAGSQAQAQTEVQVQTDARDSSVDGAADMSISVDGPGTLILEKQSDDNDIEFLVDDFNSSSYETDEAKVVEAIRNAMEARQGEIQIKIRLDKPADSSEKMDDVEGWISAKLDGWMESALEETTSPTQGDYLRYMLGSGGSYRFTFDFINDYYYTVVKLNLNYYTTAEQEKALDTKLGQVMAGFGFTENTTDYQKVAAIYDYITDNVAYDNENLDNDKYELKYTAYAAAVNGKAVCQGYATLLYRMMREAGINARVIIGTSQGGDHAWNIVKLGNTYYLVDSTWDAGQKEYSYFLKGSNSFADHTPSKDFLGTEFATGYPVSGEDYQVTDADTGSETGDDTGDGTGTGTETSISDVSIDFAIVKILRPKAAKKAVTVRWKKLKSKNLNKTKKIQIQYSTDKTFKTGVKTKYANAKKTSLKIKHLKSKKKYYVRVRAYTKSGDKVHVSKWSKVRRVKVK